MAATLALGSQVCYNNGMATTLKYSKELLEEAVRQSVSYAGVLRVLGIKQAGGSQSYIKKTITGFQIDTSHFTGMAHNKGKISNKRLTPKELLVKMPEGSFRQRHYLLKRAMIESGVTLSCGVEDCPSPGPFWKGKPLTLDIDHVDGDWLNNLLENLRFACPNCHSQEPTNKPWKNS